MSSTIQIKDFRLSFIWFRPLFPPLGSKIPDSVPFSFLWSNDGYQKMFEQVQQNPKGVLAPDGKTTLTLPWPTPPQLYTHRQRFWIYYLQTETEKVNSKWARLKFVPFRGEASIKVKSPDWLPGGKRKFFLEAFYYPFGVGLVATAHCEDDFTLNQAVDMAFQFKMGGKFEVEQPETARGSFSLDNLSDMAINLLHEHAWGKDITSGLTTITPFSIFTVVRGNMDDDSLKVPPDEEIQKSLQAVTNWNRDDLIANTLEQADLLTIRKKLSSSTPDHNPGPSHVLYATKKGRAVWFPDVFKQDMQKAKLSCYHRNLIFTTLQVESFLGLISESENLLPDLSPRQREYLGGPLSILGSLYGSKGDAHNTYRSWSARAQIEEMLEEVNKVRTFLTLDPLS